MPLDGIVANNIALELKEKVLGSKITKIYQPEKDEILMHIRKTGTNYKLLFSANANYPRVHLTDVSRENPSNPPVFCMLLRKHIAGGKVLDVIFHDFERILTFNIESVNELGDLSIKRLIIEIMGRHSNIILVNENGKIIDSIKHVDSDMSRVREVMPAREYVLPPAQEKVNPLELDINNLIENASFSQLNIEKYLLNNIKGFSPFICKEICFRAGIDGKVFASDIPNNEIFTSHLKYAIYETIQKIKNKVYTPCIVYNRYTPFEENIIPSNNKEGIPLDFHCLPVSQYENVAYFDSISLVLDVFYSKKDFYNKLHQKINSLTRVLDTHLERCRKKLAIQQDTLREVSDREKLKLYGELITAFIHSVPPNSKKVSLPNYYSEDNEYIDIVLNENKTPQENAQIYFKRYNKAKSTFHNVSRQLKGTIEELEYLESVLDLLSRCSTITEVEEIREELIEQGYIDIKSKKANKFRKKETADSSPLHYKSSDGFDIYVGKNNKQNDFLTFKFSGSKDIWLHVRNIPGSHTIIKCHKKDVSESTLVEAATAAAWHSKALHSSNVPVDYTLVKHVKKPGSAKPGMVIYENFKTIFVTPDENLVKKMRIV